MNETEDLFALAGRAEDIAKLADEPAVVQTLETLEHVAKEFGKAWSGSWLGYHTCVYYLDFQTPPPGARFSQEWGFMDTYAIRATEGEWREYAFDDVTALIYDQAGNPDLGGLESDSADAAEKAEDIQSTLISRLSSAVRRDPEDTFLAALLEGAKKPRCLSATEIAESMRPRGQMMSRDIVALEKGLRTPAHLKVLARAYALGQPFHVCRELSKVAQRAASHLSDTEKKEKAKSRIGTKVFIGHGRAAAWKDLRDFVRDRLHLPWDEFNRVPVAGFTNIARLSQMLDEAAFAFVILTAEDEQADGTLRARMNVIHEAGLFQGRLGFEKAILVLEEGCEEFSNVQGLGQLRFPKANIAAAFEQIREVLEREGLLE